MLAGSDLSTAVVMHSVAAKAANIVSRVVAALRLDAMASFAAAVITAHTHLWYLPPCHGPPVHPAVAVFCCCVVPDEPFECHVTRMVPVIHIGPII